jgi:hypothetical protein
MREITRTVQRLRVRQRGIRKLTPSNAEKRVLVQLQTQHAAYGACAELLEELQPFLQLEGSRKPTPRDLEDAHGPEILSTLVDLIDSAEDLAAGRDSEVLLKVGWRVLGTAAKWFAKLSPIRPEDAEDALDALEAIGDIKGTHVATRKRRNQTKAASVILKWSKSATILAMYWAMEAQRVLDLLSRGAASTDAQLVSSVQQRMVAQAGSW